MSPTWSADHPAAQVLATVARLLGREAAEGGALGGDVARAQEVLRTLDGGERFVGVAVSARMALSLYDAHVDWAFGIEDLETDHARDAVLRLWSVGLAAHLAGEGDAEARAEAFSATPAGAAALDWLGAVELALAFATEDEPLDAGFVAGLCDDHGEDVADELEDLADEATQDAGWGVMQALLPRLEARASAAGAVLGELAAALRELLPPIEDADQDVLAAEIDQVPVYGLIADLLGGDGAEEGPHAAERAAWREARAAWQALRTRREEAAARREALETRRKAAVQERVALERRRAAVAAEADPGAARRAALANARKRMGKAQHELSRAQRRLESVEGVLAPLLAVEEAAAEHAALAAELASLRGEAEALEASLVRGRQEEESLALEIEMAEELARELATLSGEELGDAGAAVSASPQVLPEATGEAGEALREAREAWLAVEGRLRSTEARAAEVAERYLAVLERRDALARRRTELRRSRPRVPSSSGAPRPDPGPARARLAEAEHQLEPLAAVLGRLEARYEAARSALEELEQGFDANHELVQTNRTIRDEGRREIRTLSMSLLGTRSSLESLEAQMVGAREEAARLAEERAEQIYALEIRLSDARKAWEDRAEARKELGLRQEALAERLESVGDDLVERRLAEAEAAECLVDLEGRLASVRTVRAALPEQLEAARTGRLDTARLRREREAAGARARAEIGSLRVHLGSQRTRMRALSQVKAKAETARDRVVARVAELEAALTATRAELEQVSSTHHDARSARLALLRSDRAGTLERLQAARARLGELRERREALVGELSGVVQRGGEVATEREERAARRGALEERLAALVRPEAELEAARGRLTAAEGGRAQAAEHASGLETSRGEAGEALAALELEVQLLETALGEARDEAEPAQRDALREALPGTREALAAAEAALAAARSSRAERIAALQAELDELRPELARLREGLGEARARAQLLAQDERRGARERAPEARRAATAAAEALDGLRARLERVQSGEIAEELTRARARLEASREALEAADGAAAAAAGEAQAGRSAVRQGEERLREADLERSAANRLLRGAQARLADLGRSRSDTAREANRVARELGGPAVSEGVSLRAGHTLIPDDDLEATDPGGGGRRAEPLGEGAASTAYPEEEDTRELVDEGERSQPPEAPKVGPVRRSPRAPPRLPDADEPAAAREGGVPPAPSLPFLGASGAAPPLGKGESLSEPTAVMDEKVGGEAPVVKRKPRRMPRAAAKPTTSVSDLLARIKKANAEGSTEPEDAGKKPAPPPVDSGAATRVLTKEELARRRAELLAELDADDDSDEVAVPPSADKTQILSPEALRKLLGDSD